VVSKAVEMVDLSLRIYHHFHDNLDAFAAKAAVFPVYLWLGLSRRTRTAAQAGGSGATTIDFQGVAW
jgi:hypothetical protein